MTVIAYSSKHRVMAADSRCTNGAPVKHLTNTQKIYRLANGALLGNAGDVDDRDIRRLFSKATMLPTRKQISSLESDIDGLLVLPKGQIYLVTSEYDEDTSLWTSSVVRISDTIVAIGTGANFAYGAMEFGASPQEAVEITCRRDIMCAGPVQSEKL